MEIKVVKDAPPPRRTRWKEVWEALDAAEPSQWVKVTADTEKAALDLRVASLTHRTLKFETRLQGRDVYLRVVERRVPS